MGRLQGKESAGLQVVGSMSLRVVEPVGREADNEENRLDSVIFV